MRDFSKSYLVMAVVMSEVSPGLADRGEVGRIHAERKPRLEIVGELRNSAKIGILAFLAIKKNN